VRREREAVLAGQRRVAALVAGGAASDDVFAAIAREVATVTGLPLVGLWRYEPDRTAVVLGASGERPHPFQAGTRWPLDGPTICAQVLDTGRPARIDDFADLPGTIAAAARATGIRACAGAPIVVDGDVWGVMSADATDSEPLPDHIEDRLAEFTELVAAAILNAASRAELAHLADEQAALRRVATLVARGVPSSELFSAVTEEAGALLDADLAAMGRHESDDTVSVVATWAAAGDHPPVDAHLPLHEDDLVSRILRTGRPARMDGDGAPAHHAVVRARLGIRSSVAGPIVVEGRVWGGFVVHSRQTDPLPADTESRLENFTDLVATAIANSEARAQAERLVDEQAALRRVATLVAQGVPPPELFAAVAREVGLLLGVEWTHMARYEPDGTSIGVAGWSPAGDAIPVGTRVGLEGGSVGGLVLRTGRPARMHDYEHASGQAGALGRERGLRSSVGAPIVVDQRLWGMLMVASKSERPLPGDTESRMTAFTELVATAISNTEARMQVTRLADEQASLRRVATLVARGAPPAEVFAAVTEEVGALLGTGLAGMARYDGAGTVTVVATWAADGDAGGAHPLVAGPWPLEGGDLASTIARTGRPVRIDDYHGVPGRIAAFVRDELGVRSSLGSPIIVEGRLWGALFVHSKPTDRALAPDAESRLTGFTELVATAIANAEAHAALASSRARIVAAADESRRRIERDLHDGTQQRLVSLMLELRLSEGAEPSDVRELKAQLARTAQGLGAVLEELREISRGIHPAILSSGGLAPSIRTLARRSAIPVELDLHSKRRLPEQVEVAAYYLVSEALANAAKHAHATVVKVELDAHDSTLRVAIRDDGVGGADPEHGSGLVGLSDRIEALGGTLEVTSPPGDGTTVLVEVPVEGEARSP
jgi:GAF domain-containing protein